MGAAITIKPNASRVLHSWDFVPEQSDMVTIRKTSLVDGTNMEVLVPRYYRDCESTWGWPMYAVHRVDLHTQLRRLATEQEGPGCPCDIQVRSKVVSYVSNIVDKGEQPPLTPHTPLRNRGAMLLTRVWTRMPTMERSRPRAVRFCRLTWSLPRTVCTRRP